MLDKTLPEPKRKEIFLALVQAQDQKMPVAESRNAIAERYGITKMLVVEIEREGIKNDWPPFNV